MRLKTFEKITLYDARYRIGYGLLVGLGLFLLVFGLDGLLPGFSQVEIDSVNGSTIASIKDNPVNAPFRLLQLTSTNVFGLNGWGVRLPSILFGATSILCLFIFLRKLYGEKIAIMGSLLAGLSSFFLIYARLGTPAIALTWSIASLLAIGSVMMTTQKVKSTHILLASVLGSVVIYFPFGWFWLLLILLAKPKEMIRTLREGNNFALIGFLAIITLALVPLVFALITSPSIAKDFVLWSGDLPKFSEFVKNILRVLLAPFWRDTILNPTTHLGNLPLLDVFSSSMVILGGLTLLFKPTLARTRVLIIILIVSTLAISLTQDRSVYAMLIIPLAVLGAVGLHRLLEEWYGLFPKNPFARVGALIPVALVLTMAVYYQLHRTFVAWPKNPEVKAAYNQRFD